jgi:hypothetical protein
VAATTYTKGWGEGGWGINGFSGIAPAYVVDGVAGTGAVEPVTILVLTPRLSLRVFRALVSSAALLYK